MQKLNRQFTAFLYKLVFFLLALAFHTQISLAAPKASPKAKAPNPKYAAIVIDANSGKTLYQENANARRFPASLTKMMTLYLLFEAMQAGRIAPQTPIVVSEYASQRPPTKIGFTPGQTIAAEAAAKALITRSANDVASAVAEYLGGSESRFAKNMTARAHQLGMMNTNFANASGLPDNNNYSTARDMAILSLALREHFPQYYHLFNISSFSFRGQTINSHNRLVRTMKGVDGIKTGFIRASGFNVATSMREDGKSLVGVVMGGRTGASRDEHMRSLLQRYIGKASKTKKSAPLVARISPSRIDQATPERIAQFTLPDGGKAPVPIAKASLVAVMEKNHVTEADPALLAFAAMPQKPAIKEIEQVLNSATEDVPTPPMAGISAPVATINKGEETSLIGSAKISDREHDALLIAALSHEYPGSQPSILAINALIENSDLASQSPLPPLPEHIPSQEVETVQEEAELPAQDQEIDIFTTASISNGKKGWVIQIATTPTIREADIALYKALSAAGSRLERAEPYLQLYDQGDERYYRARFSGFKSQKSALNACVDLQSRAIDCYVFED